ncbi:hypothetical protein HYALB_00011498 [Hymenoscyphus albidus]|uniref:Uncharacterized protein n=1 Tax=Hymenoscyphus albidus TaxID=595503 RepID=A0A9N9Q8R6_9HELO|nr:hypothetical protein HYALB_00011498 [Hymenoscyphus albidus]
MADFCLNWPNRGVWLNPEEVPESSDTDRLSASMNSRAVDKILIILRLLIAFGYRLDGESSSTPAEKEFHDCAWLDIGRDQIEDCKIKRPVFEQLEPTRAAEDPFRIWNFWELLHHPLLHNLFIESKQLTLHENNVIAVRYPGDSFWKVEETDFPAYPTMINYNGVGTLGDCISSTFEAKRFRNGKLQLRLGKRPKFLMVRYTNEGVSQKGISDFRTVEYPCPFRIKTNEDQYLVEQTTAVNNLLAVVRVSEGEEDERIRTYHKDGSEITPAQIGQFRGKEPNPEEAHLWSIKEPGCYILFYYTVDLAEGQDNCEIVVDAPESICRPWCKGKSKGRDFPPRSSSGLTKSSETNDASQAS